MCSKTNWGSWHKKRNVLKLLKFMAYDQEIIVFIFCDRLLNAIFYVYYIYYSLRWLCLCNLLRIQIGISLLGNKNKNF